MTPPKVGSAKQWDTETACCDIEMLVRDFTDPADKTANLSTPTPSLGKKYDNIPRHEKGGGDRASG